MKATYDIVDLGMLLMEEYKSYIKMHTWVNLIMNHLQLVNLAS